MEALTKTISISEKTFARLVHRAEQTQRPVDNVAEELLQVYVRPTKHPYVVRQEGYRGGRPILRGTNMPVWLMVAMWKSGDTMDEISIAYPHLEPAAVYDAISYYLDHQEEIESQIAENKIHKVLRDAGATMYEDGVIQFGDE